MGIRSCAFRAGRLGLAATVLVMLAIPAAFGQTAHVQYLMDEGIPYSNMEVEVPTGPLINLDPGRDSELGLFLQKSSKGSAETDPTKFQFWSEPSAGGLVLDGAVSLTIYAAMKDYDDEKRGVLNAYLMDCKSNLTGCTSIAFGSATGSPWSPTGGFVGRTISFGEVSHEVLNGRRLAVKLVVDDGSDDDMYLAYAAASYASNLKFVEAGGGTTTTTGATTTTSGATTTTTGATTTTTGATTTTSGATTTTTGATTTTTGATTTSGATTTTTTETSGSQTIVVSIDPPAPQDIALPSLADVVADDPHVGEAHGVMVDGLLNAVELFLPEQAAQVAVSPMMVLQVIVDAMFLTGRSISLPAAGAGVLTGLLIIGSGHLRRPKQVVS